LVVALEGGLEVVDVGGREGWLEMPDVTEVAEFTDTCDTTGAELVEVVVAEFADTTATELELVRAAKDAVEVVVAANKELNAGQLEAGWAVKIPGTQPEGKLPSKTAKIVCPAEQNRAVPLLNDTEFHTSLPSTIENAVVISPTVDKGVKRSNVTPTFVETENPLLDNWLFEILKMAADEHIDVVVPSAPRNVAPITWRLLMLAFEKNCNIKGTAAWLVLYQPIIVIYKIRYIGGGD
jgi:hypothetical protein